MRHHIFLLILLFSISHAYADSEMETIYYDKDWKGVQTRHFATFYRMIEKKPAKGLPKKYRDFFISGELQGEGNYVSINRNDNSQSVMDGECITYYKNGQVESKRHFSNGNENGEIVYFYDDGSLQKREYLLNGKRHGMYTEVSKDGVCSQQEYEDGNPKYDYRIVSNTKGLYSKIRTSDNTPIYVTPALSDQKTEYRDGITWLSYLNDGIKIAITNKEINDYGKYYRIYVELNNNSFFPIEFDPVESSAILTDKKGKEIPLEIQSFQDYDKKIRRSQFWEEFACELGNTSAANNAGYTTTTTTTSYTGDSKSKATASAYGSGGYAYGTATEVTNESGSSKSTTTTYDPAAAYQARKIAYQNIANFAENNRQKRESRKQDYLKRTIINPGESINGYFNIKRKKGDELLVTLKIAGVEYAFPWDVKQ